MATQATAQRTPEKIPDDRVLGEYEAGPRTYYALKATMPVFTVLVQGGNNVGFQVRRPYEWPAAEVAGKPRIYFARAAGRLQVSGLVHVRALGNPAVSPQTRPSGLVHTRAQGALTVIPPPTTPPVIPPDTPPVTPVTSPRNLRYVRRRNRPPERG